MVCITHTTWDSIACAEETVIQNCQQVHKSSWLCLVLRVVFPFLICVSLAFPFDLSKSDVLFLTHMM